MKLLEPAPVFQFLPEQEELLVLILFQAGGSLALAPAPALESLLVQAAQSLALALPLEVLRVQAPRSLVPVQAPRSLVPDLSIQSRT